jgi:hypothetical protein
MGFNQALLYETGSITACLQEKQKNPPVGRVYWPVMVSSSAQFTRFFNRQQQSPGSLMRFVSFAAFIP